MLNKQFACERIGAWAGFGMIWVLQDLMSRGYAWILDGHCYAASAALLFIKNTSL